MSVRRVMGTETEYAITLRGAQRYDPIALSHRLIRAAGELKEVGVPIRWDYRQEDPTCDLRGGRLARNLAHPDLLTDAPVHRSNNVVAHNGGRLYVDHAHPEYSSPESMDPFEAVYYDRAGDLLLLQASDRVFDQSGERIDLYRNNTDGKGASWGAHDNYALNSDVPIALLQSVMVSHLVTRQIYVGSGRVGIGVQTSRAGFQLSQRADFMQSVIGLQTTFDRPLLNTRHEPHTLANRRLHIIAGDANLSTACDALKMGVTSLVLWLLENRAVLESDDHYWTSQFALADPVQACHSVSYDVSLRHMLELESGDHRTAWQMQVRFLTHIAALGASLYGTDSTGEPLWPDEATKTILANWKQALVQIQHVAHASDKKRLGLQEPAACLEWFAKWQVLERFRGRNHLDWLDPRMLALDLRWSILDPHVRLSGKVLDRTEEREPIARAAIQAPTDTRAWLRQYGIEHYRDEVLAISWSAITARVSHSSIDMDDSSASQSRPASGEHSAAMANSFTLIMDHPEHYTQHDCQTVMSRLRQQGVTNPSLAELLQALYYFYHS